MAVSGVIFYLRAHHHVRQSRDHRVLVIPRSLQMIDLRAKIATYCGGGCWHHHQDTDSVAIAFRMMIVVIVIAIMDSCVRW